MNRKPLVKIPKHIAIIMDGNGRWAQKRNRPRVYGHIRGASRIKSIVKRADSLGVKAMTLFAFSTENWTRPESELSVLWKLLKKFLRNEIGELDKQNVRMRIIGEVHRLPEDVQTIIHQSVSRLSKNTGIQLSFALSYGSRLELMQAAQAFANDCVSGSKNANSLTEDLFEKYLTTHELGDLAQVDLLIRTSGEKRISNFLLWQCAYAEMLFLDLFWPDFSPDHLEEAIHEYSQRDRRFGGVTT